MQKLSEKPTTRNEERQTPIVNQQVEQSLASQLRQVQLDKESKERDVRNQVRAASAAAARRLEAQKNEEKIADKAEKEKAKPVKLGDSGELHDTDDWDWDDSSEDWDGTVDRTGKNKERKK